MRGLKEAAVLLPGSTALGVDEYQHVIEKSIRVLCELERRAIFHRFWEPKTIAQVADQMGLTWEQADHLIDQAVRKIQEEIKRHKNYKHPL